MPNSTLPKNSLPKIRAFKVRALRVPMTEAHKTAGGEITESPLVLLDIITDAGITGHSMVFTYTPMALQPTAQLIANFEQLVGNPRSAASYRCRRLRLFNAGCHENRWRSRQRCQLERRRARPIFGLNCIFRGQ
jgi:hypothetical protein